MTVNWERSVRRKSTEVGRFVFSMGGRSAVSLPGRFSSVGVSADSTGGYREDPGDLASGSKASSRLTGSIRVNARSRFRSIRLSTLFLLVDCAPRFVRSIDPLGGWFSEPRGGCWSIPTWSPIGWCRSRAALSGLRIWSVARRSLHGTREDRSL